MALLSVYSCKNDSSNTNSEIETSLEINIPISSVLSHNSESLQNKGSEDYTFSGENIYSPSTLEVNSDRVNEFQLIKPNNESILQIPGISEGTQISSLKLVWGYRVAENEDFIFQESIDLSTKEIHAKEGIYVINLGKSLNPLIDRLNSGQSYTIKVKVSGNSNFQFSGNATLNIPVVVETSTYSVRFELF